MLSEFDVSNFQTLSKAFADGNVALMEVTRNSDSKPVAVIVAMGREGSDFLPVPFAVMVEGNPFELFTPPEGVDVKEGD